MIAGLINLISSDSALSAIIGGIYPMILPEGTLDGITYRIIGGNSEPTFTSSGPQRVRIEFDFVSPSYATADSGRNALRSLLDGYQGLLSDGTLLQNCMFIQPIDRPYDNISRQYRLSSEFYCYFNLSS